MQYEVAGHMVTQIKFPSPPIPSQKPPSIDLIDPTDRYYCIYIQYLSGREMTMPRDYEIMMAFKQAMKRDASGRFTISTLDFVSELERLNWHYTLRAANSWIEMHTTTFRDISTADGDERTFQVFNPNGGM